MTPRIRTLHRSLGGTLVLLLLYSPWIGNELARSIPYGPDAHAETSLDIAIDRALCGGPSNESNGYRIAPALVGHPHWLDRPLRDVAAERAGSLEAYCASATVRVLNNENSLMLLERWILDAMPGASIRTIGQVLFGLKVACALVFVFGLLLLGAPFLSCAALLGCALTIAASLDHHHFSVYPLILPVLLLQVGLGAIALRYNVARRWIGLVALAVAAGVLSSFTVNLRTDTAPLCLAVWGIVMTLAVRRRLDLDSSRWQPARAAGVIVVAACAGWLTFAAAFIRPLSSGVVTAKPTHHGVAHPLVLSLGVPRNEFASSQGVEWDDGAGNQLALRVDPTVSYLGPRYEPTLFRFYGQLWRTHPREMLAVYAMKFSVAGRSMMQGLYTLRFGAIWWQVLLFPLTRITSGLVLLALFAVAAAWSARVASRDGSALAAVASIVAVVGALVQIEASLLVSHFALQYHSVELFAVAFVCVAAYQWLLDKTATAVARSTPTSETRTVACLVAFVIVVYASAAAVAEHHMIGSFDPTGSVLPTALAYGGLAASAYLAFRGICRRGPATVLSVVCLVMASGRPAIAELTAAVCIAALLFVFTRAIVAPVDATDQVRFAGLAGASAGVAVAAGADLLATATVMLAGSVLSTAWPLGIRAALRVVALVVAVFVVVAWIGGGLGGARADASMPASGVRQYVAVAPASLDKSARRAVVNLALRSRFHGAQALAWVSLCLAPLVTLLVGVRRPRLGVWLFMCWLWVVTIAPAQSQPAAIVGLSLAGVLTLTMVAATIAGKTTVGQPLAQTS